MVLFLWTGVCMHSKVPLFKGKGDMYECSTSRDVSLLSVVGKLYGKR